MRRNQRRARTGKRSQPTKPRSSIRFEKPKPSCSGWSAIRHPEQLPRRFHSPRLRLRHNHNNRLRHPDRRQPHQASSMQTRRKRPSLRHQAPRRRAIKSHRLPHRLDRPHLRLPRCLRRLITPRRRHSLLRAPRHRVVRLRRSPRKAPRPPIASVASVRGFTKSRGSFAAAAKSGRPSKWKINGTCRTCWRFC